jgi:hypothetical protein
LHVEDLLDRRLDSRNAATKPLRKSTTATPHFSSLLRSANGTASIAEVSTGTPNILCIALSSFVHTAPPSRAGDLSGAQTERRGGAGPAGGACLAVRTPPAAFCRNQESGVRSHFGYLSASGFLTPGKLDRATRIVERRIRTRDQRAERGQAPLGSRRLVISMLASRLGGGRLARAATSPPRACSPALRRAAPAAQRPRSAGSSIPEGSWPHAPSCPDSP